MKIERGTKILVDTNVLLEATDEGRQLHLQALAVFQKAPELGVDLFLCTQVVREYLVVATRPLENNGLGMSTAGALENIRRFRSRAALLGESPRAGELFLEWTGKYGYHGKRLHDLQILATATAEGMNLLLTANARDFPQTTPIAVMALMDFES